jgi:glycosyltransferase involved in cell wall biosynthesis
MKIAILGTRGIPNHYGGFEQFAEYLSKGLVELGHSVYVYNPHNHVYQKKSWNGVQVLHQFDPEYKIGTVGQFIYDFNCIIDSCKRNFDIILQLGYTSSSVWGWLLPKQSVVITNMDGLEWRRTKYSKTVQRALKYAEKWAIETSDHLIADSIGIQNYLMKNYNVNSFYIPYGAFLFQSPDPVAITPYHLQPYTYDMLIARLEPENSIEAILQGVTDSKSSRPFLVIGNYTSTYGTYLKAKFTDTRIRFMGAIYDISVLNNLRYFSNLYFHGHTVGGTNPSLLEAMASAALICANDNEFNRSILGSDAYYFTDSVSVQKVLESVTKKNGREEDKIDQNIKKIKQLYSWDKIIRDYEQFMEQCLQQKAVIS